MKTVKECGSLFEAQVVRQRLESERIQAFVLNENSNDYVPFAGAIPLLAVQVVVADDDYERVRDLLAEETASERPIVCPECGSQGVRSEVGETRLKRFGAYLLAGLGALGNGSAGNIRRYFRCNRCGTPFHWLTLLVRRKTVSTSRPKCTAIRRRTARLFLAIRRSGSWLRFGRMARSTRTL